jgi:hypothetical protein
MAQVVAALPLLWQSCCVLTFATKPTLALQVPQAFMALHGAASDKTAWFCFFQQLVWLYILFW